MKIRYEGDREFTNGALANEFTGQALGNSALMGNGLNPDNPGDDFVTYKQALNNPFSYVRTTALPPPGWSGPWPQAEAMSYGSGTGVPSAEAPDGSVYVRTDTPFDIYVRKDGAWVDSGSNANATPTSVSKQPGVASNLVAATPTPTVPASPVTGNLTVMEDADEYRAAQHNGTVWSWAGAAFTKE